MRYQSKKTAARERECHEFRWLFTQEVCRCEACGHDPTNVKPGQIRWRLETHEIARGSLRQKALDKRYAILRVCLPCHDEMGNRREWPDARQLAALRKSRPDDYDLVAFNKLVGRGPNRITQEDVDAYGGQ